MDLRVRPELPGDEPGVRAVEEAAFGQPDEADLVDALRASGCERISLVCEAEGRIVGHVLLTPSVLSDPDGRDVLEGWGLAPMAVDPGVQRQGIGTRLGTAALDEARRRGGAAYVIVLGHAAYYPRFGFVPASRFGVRSTFDGIPDEAFMLAELVPGAVAAALGVAGGGKGDGPSGETVGVARYRPEFG